MNGAKLTLGLVGIGAVASLALGRRGSPSAPPMLPLSPERRRTFSRWAQAYTKWFNGLLIKPFPHRDRAWAEENGLDGHLGSGKHRSVFAVPEGALKFEDVGTLKNKYPRNHVSNLAEAKAWDEATPAMRRALVPVLAHAEDGSWLLMERAEPLKKAEPFSPEIIAIAQCGLTDLIRDNRSTDGRLLDYGDVPDKAAWQACLDREREHDRAVGSRSALGRAPSKKLVHIVSRPALAALWRDRKQGATGELVAWVEIAKGAGPSYRTGLPIDSILDRLGDWSWSEGEAVAVERAHAELVLLQKHFNRIRFPLVVYRGLEVPPGKTVDTHDPGAHWTANRAVALAFAQGRHVSSHRERTGDESGKPVLLSGTLSGPHAVRWHETFRMYLDYTMDHAGDPEVAEEQLTAAIVRDVRVVPLQRSARAKGSRATIRAKAQRFEAMIDPSGIAHPVPPWSAVKARLIADGFTTDLDVGTTFSEIVAYALDTLAQKQPEERSRPATKTNATNLAWSWIQKQYDDFVASVGTFTDPLTLYREVTARRSSDIRIENIGIFWSWDPEAAEAYWGQKDRSHWLLVAHVAARHVDWMATTLANVRMPYEREVTLLPGSPVHLLRIRNDDGAEVVDAWGTA